MPRVSSFVGLFFDPSRAGPLERVTTPPYDTITGAARRRFAEASPYNVVRLDLAGPDDGAGEDADDPGAPPGTSEGREDPYATAGALLGRWHEEGILVADRGPALYPYEMRFSHRGRARLVRGLVCLIELEPWGGRVLPHERTMERSVEDRLLLLRATRANLSCVYATIAGPDQALQDVLDGATGGSPLREMADEDGVIHRLWRLEEAGLPPALAEEPLMIADGHHRYATALRFRDEMRASYGTGPWDHVLALIVDVATQDPPVLPYHRLLLEGSPVGGGDRVRDLEEVLAELSDDELAYGIASREDGELVHRVGMLTGTPPTVCAVHEQVLRDVPEGSLRYTQDPVIAEQAVRDGRAVAAYFLPPTSADRIRDVVDRGERLPEKSTFFWPKPRTGMVIRTLD